MIRAAACSLALTLLAAPAALAGPPAPTPPAPPSPAATAPAPPLDPVPVQEAALWASGSTWCLNPDGDNCQALFYWSPGQNGRSLEVAVVGVGASESDGVVMAASSFDLRDGRQCYRVDPSDIRFSAVAPNGQPDQAAVTRIENEWRADMRAHAGRNECVAFFRERGTGLVRQRRYFEGVLQPAEPNEVFRITVGRPGEVDEAI